MKKIFAILLVCMMIFSLVACNNNAGNNEPSTNNADGSTEIQWQTLADDDIVGAWEPEDSVAGEYILFTPEGKLRVVYGTVVFDAAIRYGTDERNNKSAYTEGQYLYGQWTYKVEEGVLTITYPKTDENDVTTFEDKIFRSVDYTPITVVAKEDFEADNALVGTWTNAQYKDSYTFTEDGYVVFNQAMDDGINVYDTEIKHSYTVENGEITLYYYKSNDNTEVSETHEYTIEGTKLLIGGSDYYLNGEGDPSVSATTAAVE